MMGWESLPLHPLILVPVAAVEADHVCIVFTCPGMMTRVRGATDLVIKLVVDGKQKVVANEYTMTIINCYIVVAGAEWSCDTDQSCAPKEKCSCEGAHLYPGTFSASFSTLWLRNNMMHTFEVACSLASDHCGLDLRHQVLQAHKGYARGIEASRMKVFPHARRCDD